MQEGEETYLILILNEDLDMGLYDGHVPATDGQRKRFKEKYLAPVKEKAKEYINANLPHPMSDEEHENMTMQEILAR